MRTKRTYDTNLIYLAINGDKENKSSIKKMVPKSTFSTWINKGVNHYIGKEYSGIIAETCQLAAELQKHKKLLQIAKSIFACYLLQKSIIDSLTGKKQILQNFKSDIIKCYNFIQRFTSKKSALKLLGVLPTAYLSI